MSKIANKFLAQMSALTIKGNNTGSTANPLDLSVSQVVTMLSAITALTGDGTASGPGSSAFTLSTVNTNVGSFAISTITVNAKGLVTAASAATTTGSGSVVLATAPTMTNPIVGTQSQGDSSTKAASTSYVDVAVANAIAGVNPAVAVQAATTSASDTSGFTYNNGVSGIGATFTGSTNTPITIDGFTFTTIGQRLLVKNDTQSPSGAFNGIYYVTQVQTGILPPILTRALDYDQPSDINNTGAIPVINGTVNGTTSWVLTSQVTTVGTSPLTFAEFTRNPADYLLKANNLSDVNSKATSLSNLGVRSGSTSISNASTSVTIAYSSTLGTTNYSLTGTMLNTTDSLPQYQPLVVTALSATGATFSWNEATDSANYVLHWKAIINV